MGTRVQAAVHRGFILRAVDGPVVYEDERDGRHPSDDSAIRRARDVHAELFHGQRMTAEVVTRYGIKLVHPEVPTKIVYAAVDDSWSPADAFAEGKRVAALLDAGTHITTLAADGTWRVELAPEPDEESDGPEPGDDSHEAGRPVVGVEDGTESGR